MKSYQVTIGNKENEIYVLQMEGFNCTDIERQVYLYNKGFEIINLTKII